MRKTAPTIALLAAIVAAPSAVFAAESYDRSDISLDLPTYVFNQVDADNNGVLEGDERQRAILFKHNDQLNN